MKKETIVIHTADWGNLSGLSDRQLGVLFRAIMTAQNGGDLPAMDKATKMAYQFMSSQIDRDNEKYVAIVEKRKAAAQKRWNKDMGENANDMQNMQVHTKNMQMHNLHSLSVSDSVSVSVSDSERDIYDSLAAVPPLSQESEAELREIYGERADGLIADVQDYYAVHPKKAFPGWPVAMAQFDRNQKRWGSTNRQIKSFEQIAAEAFSGMEDTI